MNLFEYEGKQILAEYGIPVPGSSWVDVSCEKQPLPCPFVLKAQVLSGGRGKSGGIKVCHQPADLIEQVPAIMGLTIKGEPVHGLLAEEMVEAQMELYAAITLQGVTKPTLILSRMGGMDIEEVSVAHPEEILKIEIDTFTGLKEYQKKMIDQQIGFDLDGQLSTFLNTMIYTFFSTKALLIEINPLGVSKGRLIAMDAKVVLDEKATEADGLINRINEGRSKLICYSPPQEEKTTVTYVPLDGEIGLISDGAGTGMLTLDLLYDEGASVSSFCELGGMTSPEVMYRALELTLKEKQSVKGVLIVLIGGFNRMDNMAQGIIQYVKEHGITIPILTRMCGTMEEAGKEAMKESGMPVGNDLIHTVKTLVQMVKEA